MTREIKFRFWSKFLDAFCIPDDDIFVDALKDPKMIVMQYTGHKDVKGKEIYEGDIVKKNHSRVKNIALGTYKVYWENDRYFPGHLSACEVIGNIYEDPELLEE